MSELIEPSSSTLKRNPLVWIILVVIGLIAFIFFGSERNAPVAPSVQEDISEPSDQLSGKIDRNLLVPPGMRARQLIEQLRAEEASIPFESIFEKALGYQQEGSLADAHLLFFFCAREGYQPAMMKMAELSDPTLFRANDSLLDQADAIQSYKWYQKLAEHGEPAVDERIRNLQQWAIQESENGDPYARQLLLVLQ